MIDPSMQLEVVRFDVKMSSGETTGHGSEAVVGEAGGP